MTPADVRAKWESRRDEWRRLGVSVNGEAVANEILTDVEQLEHESPSDALTLSEGARVSGYSTDHLRHLIAAGQLENLGRKHAPRVRRGDLPRKATMSPTPRIGAYNADDDALTLAVRRTRSNAGGSAQ
jgi:hypothetical protein